ncbi:hypothetical protein BaRGS_00007845 [Batillaria attramentaria]|uniref:Uncharacterized protein n=1 Tax=Batillaria attramentaria TaxID=370345 RepID=A0ABD0LND7_9CAEN
MSNDHSDKPRARESQNEIYVSMFLNDVANPLQEAATGARHLLSRDITQPTTVADLSLRARAGRQVVVRVTSHVFSKRLHRVYYLAMFP